MSIELLLQKKGPKISKYIYGQFSEHLGHGIYGGLYVGEDSDIPNVNGMRRDVVAALKAIHVPVLRWPGGLFADTYHWQDGIGSKATRKKIVNTNWGDVTEDNSFGTHEYFELLRQLGADAYINANIGSGTVQEMAEWVEYMTMAGESPMSKLRQENGRQEPWPLKFFGIGNESWGGGGNMRPTYYADVYRQYQTFLPQYDKDQPIYKVACGPNEDDYNWTDNVMKIAGKYLDALSLHYYTIPTNDWQHKGSATDFPEAQWDATMSQTQQMDELITRHTTIMDKYDPDHKVDLIVDEWGTWYDVTENTNPGFLQQQNTIRDAMVAAINLNIFQKHADRVHMTNIAQMVNVLQAMILTDGAKMLKTPTYYVFDMYQKHMDAELISGIGAVPENVSYTASQKDGELTISVVNYDAYEANQLDFTGIQAYQTIQTATILTAQAMDAHNTFEEPDVVQEVAYTGATLSQAGLQLKLPAKSVVTITLK
ncbi:alpha-N-arabinofuranosidase [Agrilactobacillus composti DSM 18527 = JCM 14202]|uniref:non-reducing end alpha-L-arabinofuranosidase n=1 Tax=Agrilactobacillus composti DSM 18527 = JCM 14202 TaxID=1423734 RepID=X0QK51_9LACO|nr:alpha-L-arabinofuranosidase C-terminal domain-containing protein [Agrilactobacillus composti]KRM30471.1 alpha-N-arabinofuranosidase [Agrilactobacillus composti DSM 18527 = JCM 14202]GAF38960.1 alpha-N-arabinofuranosidase 2 [Agrilactobacillus composti DSM 18527 = JCM 14202]